MPFRVIVPRQLVDAMVAHALAERPNECCGVLAGVTDEGVVRAVAHYPLVNALASPTEYESDPRSMFHAVRDMRAAYLDIVAVYHSHPTSPAVPSKKDLARNYSEDVVNFIVSLLTSPPTIRAWWLTDTQFSGAEWEIESQQASGGR
jgi:proteasome lid subunit RPN8/RPN11